MSTNISCLETFALNILKSTSSDKILDESDIPELDPCSLCNQELFLFELKNPITILVCGHTYHRDCVETFIKKHSRCPKPDCKKEVEEAKPRDYVSSTVDSMPGSQNNEDLMDISPSIFKDTKINESSSQKRTSDYPLFPDKPSNKKVKKVGEKKESKLLNKFIEELIGDSPEASETSTLAISTSTTHMDMSKLETLIPLYQNITNAESNNDKASHEVLRTYFVFGLWISKRYEFHRKSNPDHTAKALVNDDIKEQLIEKVTETTLWKRTERAKKIYAIFSEAGENKIQQVKSLTANAISKLPWPSVVINISKKKQSASGYTAPHIM